MEDQRRDYYEVLGVAKDADSKAIKNAFRDLALKYHPDRNKDPGAEDRFKEIAEAYAILSDEKKRADYDARGFAAVSGLGREDLFGGINFDDIFGGLNFDFGAGSPFGAFFRHHRSGPATGANIEVDVMVSLELVASGGEAEVRLARPVTCSACHGTGEEGGAAPAECDACQGTGRITRSQREDQEHVLIQHITTCPECQGRGYKLEHPCTQCKGRGVSEQDELLTVKIPVGAEDGLSLRVPGKGMPSPDTGGKTGDLYAVVRTQPDARFERVGADLLRLETIPVTDAVLGVTLTVPTLQGSASVAVPPGTQADTVLRMKKKGLPVLGGALHGDMFVRIWVQIPEHLTAQEHALYEKLRELRSPPKA